MKRIFQFFLIILGLFAMLSASAQRINPTTQIKRAAGQDTILVSEADGDFLYKPASYLQSLIPTLTQDSVAPTDPPGDNQSWIYVDTSSGGGVYIFDGDDWLGPVTFIIQDDGAPTDPPANNQSWIYVDTDNNVLYYWDGDSWEVMDVTDKTYANGLTETGDTIVRWGGDLTQATIINSKGLRNVTFDSIPSFFVRARTGGASTAVTTLWASNTSASGFNTSSLFASDLTQGSQIAVRPIVSSWIRQYTSAYGGEVRTTPTSARIISQTISGETATDAIAVIVDTAGTFITNLPARTAAATKLLWQNPSTDEIYEGSPAMGTATLVGGTVTVSSTAVAVGSKIFVFHNTPGGTQGILSAPDADIVAGVSFVIDSTNGADTSTVNWIIFN